MNVPAAAKTLIREFEALRLIAYRCSAGHWTIGWGHTSAAGPPRVREGMRITRAEADAIFERDVADVAATLRPLIDTALTEHQFGALVSFAFNAGVGAFATSDLLEAINGRRLEDVPAELQRWNKETVNGRKRVSRGLVRRRAAEVALWRGEAAAAPADQTAPRVLRIETPPMTGPDVVAVQEALRRRAIDPGPVDGSYGPRTATAVRRFQGAIGLVADGVVGLATRGPLLT